MLNAIIEFLALFLPFYQASQDAGTGLLNKDGIRVYLEAYLMERGAL